MNERCENNNQVLPVKKSGEEKHSCPGSRSFLTATCSMNLQLFCVPLVCIELRVWMGQARVQGTDRVEPRLDGEAGVGAAVSKRYMTTLACRVRHWPHSAKPEGLQC